MLLQLPRLWMGSDDQLLQHAEALIRLNDVRDLASLSSQLVAGSVDFRSKYTEEKEEAGEDPGLLDILADNISEIHGSVGLVRVEGSLVNRDSIFNLWFGGVSYNTISFALQRFAEDSDISAMVMSFATGGGQAAGIEQGATNLSQLRKIKPLYSFVDQAALSAGYWLAAEGESISAHKMSQVGSIGALLQHQSIHRLLKQAGIDAEVFRAGAQKALGHPVEETTKEARAQMQKQVETFRGYFVSNILSRRPDMAASSELWMEGQEMFSTEGKEASLVDEIVPFGEFLSRLDENEANPRVSAGRGIPGIHTQREQETLMARKIVIQNPEQAAALAGGAVLPGMEIPEDADPKGAEQLGSAGVAETSNTEVEASSGQESAGEESPTPKAEDKPSDLLAFLKSENVDLRDKVSSLTAQVEKQKLEIEAASGNREKFRVITAELLLHRQIALGQTPLDVTQMSDANMLQMFDTLEPAFKKAYKIGAQSVPAGETADDQPLDKQAASLGIFPRS